MFDEESPSSDHPQGHAPSKAGQDLQFLLRASEESGKCRQLGRRLRVTDHGLGVGKQALGESALLASGSSARPEVRSPVADGYVGQTVRASELPGRPEIAGNGQVGEHCPCLVDDKDRLC